MITNYGNKDTNKIKTSSSIKRTINQLITGFTIEQNISYKEYKEKTKPSIDNKETILKEKQNLYQLIKGIIENSNDYLNKFLKKKDCYTHEIPTQTNEFTQLEDAVSIKKPYAGRSRYAGYLNKLKFNE